MGDTIRAVSYHHSAKHTAKITKLGIRKMQPDSTTNLVRGEYTPSIGSQQDLPEYSPPDPPPRYKSATAGVSKNPLKRLSTALKNEPEEIKALQGMTLEEIKAHNMEVMERHVKK